MKKLMIPAVVIAALFTASCASVTPGNDPVVVNAERTIQNATDVFDTLFTIEQRNHALLKLNAPQVVAGVNEVRLTGPKALNALVTATEAYKANRNAENKATVQTYLATLAAIIAQAQGTLQALNAQIGGA